jgi:hypothetical protein
VPDREPADRATHADDERLVFCDADAALSSEATLSAPAATWQQARPTSTASISPRVLTATSDQRLWLTVPRLAPTRRPYRMDSIQQSLEHRLATMRPPCLAAAC